MRFQEIAIDQKVVRTANVEFPRLQTLSGYSPGVYPGTVVINLSNIPFHVQLLAFMVCCYDIRGIRNNEQSRETSPVGVRLYLAMSYE